MTRTITSRQEGLQKSLESQSMMPPRESAQKLPLSSGAFLVSCNSLPELLQVPCRHQGWTA